MDKEYILIIDFGGQYKELIARRLREIGISSLLVKPDISLKEIKKAPPAGIILSGGPMSVYDPKAPKCDEEIFALGIPVLAICYGMQLMANALCGKVVSAVKSEFGQHELSIIGESELFSGLNQTELCLMSHTDRVSEVPEGFKCCAKSKGCEIAAMDCQEKKLYGVQFHPEAELTEHGMQVIKNFAKICGLNEGVFTEEDFIGEQIEAIKRQVGDQKVILGLSGGVDSSVCASLISKAIGKNLICIFIDHGLMRKNEPEQVEAAFSGDELTFVHIDASERFLKMLAGVTDPEQKRKIIGAQFVEEFSQAAKNYSDASFLAQGTIYPDIVESGANGSAVIKSHHNVGGLPENMSFTGLVEPIRSLFKDEVRKVGAKLGLPDEIVNRQPFPGPGLAVRCIGEITREKLDILREADAIFREEIDKSGIKPSQYFAIITDLRSVGVMGDFRTYDFMIALRAITTNDFMTAQCTPIPFELLSLVSRRITNEVKGVNRVVFDVSNKPPATVEWE